MIGRAWAALGLAAILAMPPGGAVQAASFLEKNFYLSGPRYDGVLPPCDYPYVLSKIAARFAEKEETFWNSALKVAAYEKIRETAFRTWAPNTIPRRFCSAYVYVSDGSRRPIHYSIGEDTGIIGATWGVEWCIVGLDRNWAYQPGCKLARP